MNDVTITKEADARGMFCPGPLMELIRLVRDAEVGDVLAVTSADEASKKDIPAWVAKARHEFLGAESLEGGTRFVCRKAR